MKINPGRVAVLLLTILAGSGLGMRHAVGSHEQVAYNFDDGVLFGWSSTSLSPGSPFGGNYLGDFSASGQVSLGILDALPAGDPANSDSRLVLLEFDIVNFFTLAEDFGITVNGNAFDLETSGSVSGIGPNVSGSLPFPLQADFNGSADMLIEFEKTVGTTAWGLDNVIVDWSQVIPEPSAFALLMVGLLLVSRRGYR